MKNIGQMMKQAQQMQSKMEEMQQALADHTETGQSGAGMVSVAMSGKHEIKSVKIDPKVIDPEDPEMLEDLIVAAANDARAKIEAYTQDRTQDLMGGLSLPPGFKLPF